MRLALLVLMLLVAAACKNSAAASRTDAGAEEASIIVRPDTTGFMFSWWDEKGDPHTVMAAKDVELIGRDAVRVLDPDREDGTHNDRCFVADMRQTKPDGTYPVSIMSRKDFEAIALKRRQEHGPTLAAAAPPSAPTATSTNPQADPSPVPAPAPSPSVAVIIYGAEWCGACKDAKRYLKKKGVPFVEKDIDEDRAAAREMQQKLRSAGLRGGSIPVLDVRGKIMVGFNPGAIDAALASGGSAL